VVTLQPIRSGRIIGGLIILQMVGGYVVNFVLEAPLFGAPGFIVNAAPHAQQIGLAALIGLAVEALWVSIAVTAFPFLKVRTPVIALLLIVLAGVVLAVAAAECAGVMSMVSVSEEYVKASDVERMQLQAMHVIVASARNWTHFTARLLDGITIFVLYAGLFQLVLVPRLIAGFGLVAVVLMIVGITMPFFGNDVVFPLLAPLGLSQLLLSVWLLVKGFREQPMP
jgi:hypothetical protein